MTIEFSNIKGDYVQMNYIFEFAKTFSVRAFKPNETNPDNWDVTIRCNEDVAKVIKRKRTLKALVKHSKNAIITLTKGIAFRTEHGGSSSVEELGLSFDATDVRRIKKAMKFCQNNEFVFSVKLDFGGYKYLNDEGEETTEWRSDVQNLIVYNDSAYFYAQSKWDAGDQIESEEITLEDLGIIQ